MLADGLFPTGSAQNQLRSRATSSRWFPLSHHQPRTPLRWAKPPKVDHFNANSLYAQKNHAATPGGCGNRVHTLITFFTIMLELLRAMV
jgi:hypothetical protein